MVFKFQQPRYEKRKEDANEISALTIGIMIHSDSF